MSKNFKMKLHINLMILDFQNLFNYNPKNFDILKCQNDKKYFTSKVKKEFKISKVKINFAVPKEFETNKT